MQDIQPELIEKYQLLLQKDPRSQVFAPLAEAYRKMGMLEEAFRVAVKGVQYNPNFAGGRIALAKLQMERENIDGATEELLKAVELSPDNILAHTLLGECHLQLKQPKEALRAFKMVLFLAPTNEKAMRAVRKLESLTADEYESEVFEMKKLPDLGSDPTPRLKPLQQGHVGTKSVPELERYLSLIDAYIVRNDTDKALETAEEAQGYHGQHKELLKRLKLIQQRGEEAQLMPPRGVPPPSRKEENLNHQIAFLENLLVRIQSQSMKR